MPTLSESDSKALLAAHGVPFPPERLAASARDAARAFAELGGPVAVKLCGEHVAHKTERGLVRLNVPTADAAERAATELLSLARPGDGATGVLVAPMIDGARELIAGVVLDPQFGHVVMVGIGGVLAEALGDVAFRLVPLTELDAREMIDDLAGKALLGEVRGEPAVDRERLASILVGLSHLVESRPDVVAIDLNPLVVARGEPVAVDALVEVAR